MCKTTPVICSLLATVAAKQCVNITIPVNVSGRNGVFNVEVPNNNLEVTEFALNLTNANGNFTEAALNGYATISGVALISAKFCTPDTLSAHSVVQVLTHGIGFDKT